MADPSVSTNLDEDQDSGEEYSSESGDESDDYSSEQGGSSVHVDNMDVDGGSASEINNSDLSFEVSQHISGSQDGYEYFGDSDMEHVTDEDVGVGGDSGQSSTVNNSDVMDVGQNGNDNVKDITEAEDKRHMFWKIKEMTFVSEPAAYVFYNSYARDNGFSIRKDKVRRSKGPKAQLCLRRYVCSREGKRDSRLLTEVGRTRRLRAESRCNCEAHLTVKLDRKRGVWYVASFNDNHSHVLARPDEVPFLWSHRKINAYQKAEILSLAAGGIRKHVIMDSFIRKHVTI